MAEDDKKVVPLRPKSAAALVDEAITPKSLADMTELEQEMFLRTLRDRRLKASQILTAARAAKRHTATVQASVKLEKKIEAVQKQYDRVDAALNKLEDMLISLRALQLQLTDRTEVRNGP